MATRSPEVDRAAHVALALTDSIGPARFRALVARFGSASGALAAPFALLRTVQGISTAAATAIRSRCPADGQAVIESCERLGGHCLLPSDPEFPETLKRIPYPPTLLFAAGDLTLLHRPAVAVVGSRSHSGYGARIATALVEDACRAGLVVVSGMARGLDAVAHQAALDVGGSSIGILGNGLGVVYPAANARLYRSMQADGLLLTEVPPGDKPGAGSFPRRNRLISGLAVATVVVEAAIRSGTMITVEAALAQGRDVVAVPGPIDSPTSAGTNRLVRDGATPYLEFADLLQFFTEYGVSAGSVGDRGRTGPPRVDSTENAILSLLGDAALPIDVLAETSGMAPSELQAQLLGLELAGLVERLAGARYARRAP